MRLAAALALAAALSATAAQAAPAFGRLCLEAADRAAAAHGVPRAILRALTRTETGRARGGSLEPWPWTVNMEGEGRWFDGPEAALAYVAEERARGAVSFDVGCFQVNHRWHGDAFPSVAAMFDPQANADYAARFLSELHAETGDWSRAAGFYHSRTPEFTKRYRARFDAILAQGETESTPQAVAALPERPSPRLWRSATEAGPPTAGAVSIRIVGAAASPIRPARGGLLRAGAPLPDGPTAAPVEAARPRPAAPDAGGEPAFP